MNTKNMIQPQTSNEAEEQARRCAPADCSATAPPEPRIVFCLYDKDGMMLGTLHDDPAELTKALANNEFGIIPPGSKVCKARLYWIADEPDSRPSPVVTESPNAPHEPRGTETVNNQKPQ